MFYIKILRAIFWYYIFYSCSLDLILVHLVLVDLQTFQFLLVKQCCVEVNLVSWLGPISCSSVILRDLVSRLVRSLNVILSFAGLKSPDIWAFETIYFVCLHSNQIARIAAVTTAAKFSHYGNTTRHLHSIGHMMYILLKHTTTVLSLFTTTTTLFSFSW